MPDRRSPSSSAGRDFLRQIIDRDIAAGRYDGVITRFPPEPNGYLHIGHAKSILLNFGIAEEYGGRCHLRFDDTNPETEEAEFVEAIKEDVRWLGFDWGEHLYHAADYFGQMYGFAEQLIRNGKAYVDSQDEAAIRESRGTVTEPGIPGPDRERPVEENLALFRGMRDGAFGEGEYVLRAKIDLAATNMLMRDPILYRIRHASHHRSGDEWCIYPMYDYAHCLEDAIEKVTHSFCTLEFENNRELYDWILDELGFEEPRPHQYEFGKGLINYTVTSKRKLLRLVRGGLVAGWDDPRLPTLTALRRRGVPPEALLAFWGRVGVARADARIDVGTLEFAIRDELNRKAPRVFAVLDPLKVVLTDWEPGRTRDLDAPYYPHDVPLEGSRTLPFSGEFFIERGDFSEDPPPGFKRLVPGGEVRLRYGCIIRCVRAVRDGEGRVVELHCTHDPDSWHGAPGSGRRVPGTIHWVPAVEAVPCEVRLYDRLFSVPDPDAAAAARGGESTILDFLNPDSLEVRERALVEPSVLGDLRGSRYQFERTGYFWRDPVDDSAARPVFNRIVTLRDVWSRRGAGLGKGDGSQAPEEADRQPKPRERRRPEPPSPGTRPKLPDELQVRADELVRRFGLTEVDAEILARDDEQGRFLEAAAEAYPGPGRGPESGVQLANWIIHELPRVRDGRALENLPFGPAELAGVVALVDQGAISSSAGAEVLAVLAREGGEPVEIVRRLDLLQVRDPESLEPVISSVLAASPGKVGQYRRGKEGLLGYFMGQVMARTGGKADPALASRLLKDRLRGESEEGAARDG
ncbi:MAG: glutamine--tRNA ligase/YqeY domain fusion protein [Acidobacteriota bacterium]|nr:glutamine--tRNA ligase/YqeY domain fusion protein [Acidobacteriota bacterium]